MSAVWPVDEWTNWLRGRGRAASTARLRRYQLLDAAAAFGVPPAEVTAEQVITRITRAHLATETRRSHLSALRSFFDWAVKVAKLVPTDPTTDLRVPETDPNPRPAEDSLILTAIAASDRPVALMLQLGALCGMRRAEIARVHSRDISRSGLGWVLSVRGKGDKPRKVPVPDAGLARAIDDAGGWLFPSPVRTGLPLTADNVGVRLRRALVDASAHQLRHRYATTVHRLTGDLLTVQRLLGHKSPTTTQRYIASDDARMHAAARAALRWGAA
jgi:integrase